MDSGVCKFDGGWSVECQSRGEDCESDDKTARGDRLERNSNANHPVPTAKPSDAGEFGRCGRWQKGRERGWEIMAKECEQQKEEESKDGDGYIMDRHTRAPTRRLKRKAESNDTGRNRRGPTQ